MTNEGLVVDVSQDWATASHVQQRFMHGAGWNAGFVQCALDQIGRFAHIWYPFSYHWANRSGALVNSQGVFVFRL